MPSDITLAMGSYNPSSDVLFFFMGSDVAFGYAFTIGGVTPTISQSGSDNQTKHGQFRRASNVSAFSFFTSGGVLLTGQALPSAGIGFGLWWWENNTDTSVTWASSFVGQPNGYSQQGSGNKSETAASLMTTAGTHSVGVTSVQAGAVAFMAFH